MPNRAPASAFASIVPAVREAVAAHLALARAMLDYCRAVAALPPEVRKDLAAALGRLAEAEATGQELLALTPSQLSALATELRVPTDHAEIRGAARRLRRGERHTLTLLQAHAAGLLTPPADGGRPAP